MKPSKLFLVIFVSILLLTVVSARVDVIIPDAPPTNYSLVNVNSSLFWDGLDTPADILHSSLDNLLWSVAGHTMDTNLDMNDYYISEVDKVYFSGSDMISSDDNGHIDMHADYVDLHGNLSTIWMVRLNADGDGLGGTRHGELVFGGGGDAYIFYNGTDLIIDPDAVGSGDVVITSAIRSSYFIGDGSHLTNLTATNVTYATIINTWINNWTAYNISWGLTYNDTQNQSISNYITENNNSIINYILNVNSTNFAGISGPYANATYVNIDGDNMTGNLNVEGNLNITGNFTGNQFYVQACYHNHTATPLNFAIDGLFYNMTFDDVDYINGFHNISQHELVCDVAGLYAVNHMAIGDGQNNHKYVSRVAINGIGEVCTGVHKKMVAGGDITTMSGTGIIRLAVGDVITLQIADDGGTGIGNYYGMNLNLHRIGD